MYVHCKCIPRVAEVPTKFAFTIVVLQDVTSTSVLKEPAAFGVRLEGRDEGKILSATFVFTCHITHVIS